MTVLKQEHSSHNDDITASVDQANSSQSEGQRSDKDMRNDIEAGSGTNHDTQIEEAIQAGRTGEQNVDHVMADEEEVFKSDTEPGLGSDGEGQDENGDNADLSDLSITPSYSVAQVASELLSLYRVMVRMYLPEDAILQPPDDEHGWPQINQESFKKLKKTPAVIELLQHLPYLRDDDGPLYMHHLCRCNNWAGQKLQHDLTFPDSQVFENIFDNVKPHEFLLGRMQDRNGIRIVFDTKNGQIRRIQPMWGVRRKFRNIQHFCDVSKKEFEQLRMVPFSSDDIMIGPKHPDDPIEDEDEEVQKIIGIYRSHGWPGEGYRKAECLAAVEEAYEAM